MVEVPRWGTVIVSALLMISPVSARDRSRSSHATGRRRSGPRLMAGEDLHPLRRLVHDEVTRGLGVLAVASDREPRARGADAQLLHRQLRVGGGPWEPTAEHRAGEPQPGVGDVGAQDAQVQVAVVE